MSKRNRNRVTFYSTVDLTIGENLVKAESILIDFNPSDSLEVNDIIELYHVKLFIDNGLFLPGWTEKEIESHRKTIGRIWSTIAKFWEGVNNENFLEHHKSLELDYRPGFWILVEKFKVYKRISTERFKEILRSKELWIREVLRQKNLTDRFGQEIEEYLLQESDSAELILSQFEQQHDREKVDLHFPKCISDADKEQIILNYLNSQNPNLNYVRLITKSKDKELKLSPKTRLKAKQLAIELNNKIFEEGTSVVVGNEVSLSFEQDEPFIETWEDNTQKISYSAKWLDKLSNELSLRPVFVSLFKYLEHGCISLISKSSELDPMETTFMRSKNDYVTGIKYTRKSNLAHLQLHLFSKYLEDKGKSIENLLLTNITEYLNKTLGLQDCRIHFPSESTSYLEKVRLLVPEIESLLKQYTIFVEEGEIIHDLHQLSSRPVSLIEIPSLLDRKYAYGTGDEYKRLAFWFFSGQSQLSYIEPYGSKYNHFYGFLTYNREYE